MKKRIISGVVMGAIVALVLFAGLKFETLVITTFLSIIAAIGVCELVCNAAGVEGVVFRIVSAVFTVAMVFISSNINQNLYRLTLTDYEYLDLNSFVWAIIVPVVYVIAVAVLILINQENFDLSKIAIVCGMPLVYAYAFSTIGSIIITTGGIYYLLLVLNFACVCDMGAYFVGVGMGKTKLCPKISPNKTVEGAVGGIVSSVIISIVITLCFGRYDAIVSTLLLTIPLCIAGMAGDLFASVIKRKTGIKDYGNLIPGHGGILDRVDSLLFISPLVFCLMLLGAL